MSSKRKTNRYFRLTELQWNTVKKRVLSGESTNSVANSYGINEATIRKRSKVEGWKASKVKIRTFSEKAVKNRREAKLIEETAMCELGLAELEAFRYIVLTEEHRQGLLDSFLHSACALQSLTIVKLRKKMRKDLDINDLATIAGVASKAIGTSMHKSAININNTNQQQTNTVDNRKLLELGIESANTMKSIYDKAKAK